MILTSLQEPTLSAWSSGLTRLQFAKSSFGVPLRALQATTSSAISRFLSVHQIESLFFGAKQHPCADFLSAHWQS